VDHRFEATFERIPRLHLEWRDDAACRRYPPDLFFVERGASVAQARAVCAHCTAQPDCLEYALILKPAAGIWGGAHLKERHAITMGRMSRADLTLLLRKAAAAWTPPTC